MKESSIKKNFAYQASYQILMLILPLITSPYVARVIGATGLGVYAYSYSIAYYFVLFSMLGLANYGNRAIAQVRGNRKELSNSFGEIVTLHAVVSIVCFGGYLVYCTFFAEYRMYAFIQAIYVLSAFFDISWFYFGIEKFKFTVTRSTIIKFISIACIFVFVRGSGDLWKYCVIMASGTLLNQVALWIPLKKYIDFQMPNWERMKKHIKPMLVLFIPAVAVSLYKYMDKIMTGLLSTKAELGFYENAEKMVNMPLMVITSFGTVMLPKMSNLMVSKNKQEAVRYIRLSMKYVMCMAFALAFGLGGIARVFAPVFWGEEFRKCGILIMGLVITLPFISFANIIRTQYLIPNERDKEYLLSVISGAVINLIINYTLIPVYGAMGATIGTISAEILVCIIQMLAVRKELPILDYIRNMWWFILFGAVMFVAVYMLGIVMDHKIVTLIVQVSVGGMIYCILCMIYFIKTKDQMILGILSKMKKYLHK